MANVFGNDVMHSVIEPHLVNNALHIYAVHNGQFVSSIVEKHGVVKFFGSALLMAMSSLVHRQRAANIELRFK